jgi:hypothetical protein
MFLSPWWLDCQSALHRLHADLRLETKLTIAQLTSRWEAVQLASMLTADTSDNKSIQESSTTSWCLAFDGA